MDIEGNSLLRATAVIGSCYIRRWLESRYDELMALPGMARLRAAKLETKLVIEALLHALTAFAEQRMTDSSPFGLVAKSLLMDVTPEIAARLLKDARSDIGRATRWDQAAGGSAVAKLLALEDEPLLALLVFAENLDEAAKGKFVAFLARATQEEVRRFASLPSEQRMVLLGMEDGAGSGAEADGRGEGWFRSFLKDFWALANASGKKTAEVSGHALKRYIAAIMQILRTSAVLITVGLVMGVGATVAGRWTLFAFVLCVAAGCAALVCFAAATRRNWLRFAGLWSCAVSLVAAFVVAMGFQYAVFAMAMFLLVGLPTIAIVAVLLPVTTLGEVFRSILPVSYESLVGSLRFLIAAFFGVVLLTVAFLLVPPRNPVALLVIVPLVLVLTLVIGLGLSRMAPGTFLGRPFILTVGALVLAAAAIMSMPNLRQALSGLPRKVDLALVREPTPVWFESSGDIDFVSSKTGEVRIWYAERPDGGFDLFRCDGGGPYYAKDGRELKRADSAAIRQKIAAWVDREAARKRKEQRRTEQEKRPAEQRAEEERREAERKGEEERVRQARLAEEQAARARDATRRTPLPAPSQIVARPGEWTVFYTAPPGTRLRPQGGKIAVQSPEGRTIEADSEDNRVQHLGDNVFRITSKEKGEVVVLVIPP
jgi:signal transduction histidine kinase